MLSSLSAAMPMPVSATRCDQRRRSLSLRCEHHANAASLCELDGIADQVVTIRRRQVGSDSMVSVFSLSR